MIKNFLKIGIRSSLKNIGATTINIIGLAIGLACFINIFTYVSIELSYDTFNSD